MKKISKTKILEAVVAISIAFAFVMPGSATLANTKVLSINRKTPFLQNGDLH